MADIGNEGKKASVAAYRVIKEHEGLFLTAYTCPAGKATIGWGHTAHVALGTRISKEDAEKFIREDVAVVEAGIVRLLTVLVTQGQFDALVSFAFNLGLGNLEKSTLLKLLNAGDAAGAAAEFDKWVNAGGKRLAGLVERRRSERVLFEQ